MCRWIKACEIIKQNGLPCGDEIKNYGVYPKSVNLYQGSYVFTAKDESDKKLVILGKGPAFSLFIGDVLPIEEDIKVCDFTHENCNVLRDIFPFTAPVSVLRNKTTIGLGDRLGVATPGHIRTVQGNDVKPILAQQSMRELKLTGRTYFDVLDDVTKAVFQEGYTGGFGADGDHLKTIEEVDMALLSGFTMITLDCSEHINNGVTSMSEDEVHCEYDRLADRRYESMYLNKDFVINEEISVRFNIIELKKIVLTFKDAIKHAADIYHIKIKTSAKNVDFEISVDEALTPTSPAAHYFITSELRALGVDFATLAPGFCGEFQKGIDYIGDIKKFEEEFTIHAAIAKSFGYKISIHSGSDKFSVFPIIGKETSGVFHVKTAGTNWLEAVRVVAEKDPKLYRTIHKYALNVLNDAKKYYHIGAKVSNIPSVDDLKDEQLPYLMDKNDSRQVIHITYGLILQAKDVDGGYIFRDKIFEVLNEYEEDYYNALQNHIGKHLKGLCI